MKAIKTIFLACALAFIPGLKAVCQITDAKTGNRVEASKIYSEAIEMHRNAELQQNRDLDLKAAALFKKAIETDPGHVPSYVQLGWIYATQMDGNFREDNYLDSAFYFAEKANDILNRCIEDVTRIKKANLYPESNLPDLQLAICQAAKGDKAKAMEHLKNNKSCNCLVINHMKNNPCFDSIRNDPEFQSILKHTESRYADAHQQMEEYLKEIAVFN